MSWPSIEPGAFDPLGATWDGRGVNFALFSQHATACFHSCLYSTMRDTKRGCAFRGALFTSGISTLVGLASRGNATGVRFYGPFCTPRGAPLQREQAFRGSLHTGARGAGSTYASRSTVT